MKEKKLEVEFSVAHGCFSAFAGMLVCIGIFIMFPSLLDGLKTTPWWIAIMLILGAGSIFGDSLRQEKET